MTGRRKWGDVSVLELSWETTSIAKVEIIIHIVCKMGTADNTSRLGDSHGCKKNRGERGEEWMKMHIIITCLGDILGILVCIPRNLTALEVLDVSLFLNGLVYSWM